MNAKLRSLALKSNLPLDVELPAAADLRKAQEAVMDVRRCAARVIPDLVDADRDGELETLYHCAVLQVGQGALAAQLWECLRRNLRQELYRGMPGYFYGYELELMNLLFRVLELHGFTATHAGWQPDAAVLAIS